MNISEIEAKIRAAVEAQRAKGVRIINGQFTGDGCLCPMACVVASAGRSTNSGVANQASRILGVDPLWVWHFAYGFDGHLGDEDGEAAILGAKLRREYIEGRNG